MRNIKILLGITLIINSAHLDLMANDSHYTDTIDNIDNTSFDKPIINLKWTAPTSNKRFAFDVPAKTSLIHCGFKMMPIPNLTTTSNTKLSIIAQGNIDRYVGNPYKAEFNMGNDREIYEQNHKRQIRMLVDPMSLRGNFNNKSRDLNPMILWKSNDRL